MPVNTRSGFIMATPSETSISDVLDQILKLRDELRIEMGDLKSQIATDIKKETDKLHETIKSLKEKNLNLKKKKNYN